MKKFIKSASNFSFTVFHGQICLFNEIMRAETVTHSYNVFILTNMIWAVLVILHYSTIVPYEPRHEKPASCIGENKCADQLSGNRTADQRLCFGYIIVVPLLPKSEISSL